MTSIVFEDAHSHQRLQDRPGNRLGGKSGGNLTSSGAHTKKTKLMTNLADAPLATPPNAVFMDGKRYPTMVQEPYETDAGKTKLRNVLNSEYPRAYHRN